MSMMSVNVGDSLAKWAMAVVLSGVLGLALFELVDSRSAIKENSREIQEVRNGDAKFEARMELVEDHYGEIQHENEQTRQLLQNLLQALGRRDLPPSRSRTRAAAPAPSRQDVLDGRP